MKGKNKIDGSDPMPELLREYGKRSAFRKTLKDVSEGCQSAAPLPAENKHTPKLKRNAWERVKINALAAACIAILTAFGTLWLSGFYKTMEKNSSNYRELRRDVNTVKQNVNEHELMIRGISAEHVNKAQNNFGATGFLLSPEGYLVTNHHVIADADSIHLQNSKGQSYKAKVIHIDPNADLAVLKITDTTFTGMKVTPYTFKTIDSDLGEDVFTLGFPRDEAVYGQGYLSSISGYQGDTTAYQISIPLNPGNSGGPLLDSRGNVIGIISGKQAGLDGTSFAIRTKALMNSLENISADSLVHPIQLNQRNTLSRLPRVEQVKRLQDYVFLVKVF